MIEVIATTYVDKNQMDEFMVLVTELVDKSRQEDGCIKYDLFKDKETDNTFFFMEKWESKKHLDNHFNTEHFKRIVGELKKVTIKEGSVSLVEQVL
jgi:quinol monooxygenase YgiN